MSSPSVLFVDLLNVDLHRITLIDTKGRTRRGVIVKHAIDIPVVAQPTLAVRFACLWMTMSALAVRLSITTVPLPSICILVAETLNTNPLLSTLLPALTLNGTYLRGSSPSTHRECCQGYEDRSCSDHCCGADSQNIVAFRRQLIVFTHV